MAIAREIVTVCQLDGQWGLYLPGCREHVTSYCTRDLSGSKQAVLDAIEQIKAYWYTDYGCELPWDVQVIE